MTTIFEQWLERSGFLIAQGKSLEWASFGPSPQNCDQGQPTIVMLHEGLGCLALWRDFPSKLSQATGLPVFAFSRAGYGQSDLADMPRPLDYLTREATRVLPQVLALFGERPLILLGHSDGATIAAEYAGRHCDPRLRGLVLMAPHFFTEPASRAAISDAKQVFETQDLKARMAKYHRDPEATFRGWNDTWLHPGFQAWNVEHVLDTLGVPALALQGKQDQYGSDEQVLVVARRSPAPVQVALLDDCRHVPFLEQPDLTLATIQGFVEGLVAGSSAQPSAQPSARS